MLKDFKNKASAYLEQPMPNIPQEVAQSTTQENEEGFFQSLVKPATELGKDLAELTPAVRETREYIAELRKTNPELADKTESLLGEKPTFKKVVGDVVGTGLLAIPLPIAKLGMMAKIASPLLKSAITGGGYMAAFSAADAMSQNKEAADIAKDAGLGFLAGTAVGGVGYLGIKGFTRLASLKPFQNAYNAITETETAKVISQYMRPVASVLSNDFGSTGKAIVDRLYNADRNTQGAVGRIMRIMDETGSKFTLDETGREASYQLGKNLRLRVGDLPATKTGLEAGEVISKVEKGKITGRIAEGGNVVGADVQEGFISKEIPENIKSLNREEFYRALLGDVAAEAESRGVKVRVPAMNGEKSYWTEFKPIENYFPQQVASLNEMKKAGFNYGKGTFKGIQQKLGLKPQDGRLRKWVIRRSVEEGDFKNEVEAAKALDGYIEFVEKEGLGVTKENGWVQYMIKSGQVDTEAEAFKVMRKVFQDQSIVKLGGSLEHARIVNNPFYNPFPDEVVPLYAIDSITRLENIEQFGVKYTGESAKLPALTKAIDQVRKSDGRNAADRFQKFLDVAMNRINNSTDEAKFVYYARMLQIPKLSFAQIVNVGQAFLNPLLKTDMRSTFIGIQKAFTDEGVKTAMESGATVQSVFNEMVKATAAGGNFADKWLKVTGFIWTEKFNRTVAANVGVKWTERNFEKLLANPSKVSYRIRLEELGVNVEKALKRGSLTSNEKLKAAQIMAEKTQFRSRPMDLPIWASSNTGKLFWQFKNFMYNQFLFVFRDNLANEIKNKQYGRAARNLLVLGTIFPMTGEVLQDIRSLVTQTRRPTKFLDRYLSDISSVGSMALISDLVDAVRFDTTDEFIMPPSLSSVTQIINKADNPEEFLKELIRQTGIGAPIVNVMKERRAGRASTIESLQDIFGQ